MRSSYVYTTSFTVCSPKGLCVPRGDVLLCHQQNELNLRETEVLIWLIMSQYANIFTILNPAQSVTITSFFIGKANFHTFKSHSWTFKIFIFFNNINNENILVFYGQIRANKNKRVSKLLKCSGFIKLIYPSTGNK